MATEVTTPSPSNPVTQSHGGVSSVNFGDFAVSSNTETVEQILEADKSEREAQDKITEAARELGKASAAKRVIKPIPDKVEAKSEPEAEESAEETAPEKLGKPRDDPKARMLEATRQAADLKRRLAEKERELAEARRPREARTEPETPRQGQTFKEDSRIEPQEENYETWGAFNRDLVKWQVGEAHREQQKTFAERQAHEAARKDAEDFHNHVNSRYENYSKKVEEAWPSKEAFESEVNPDLISWETSVEVRNRGEQIGPENVIADEIVNADDPVPLMRYLSQHPDELQRIAALSSSRAIGREMAKIEDRATSDRGSAVTTASAPKAEVSKAPKPVRPVTGAPHAGVDPMSDDTSFDDYVRIMDAKERKSARR